MEGKDEGQTPTDRMHFFPLAGEGLEKGKRDKSNGKSPVDVEGEGDRDKGEEGGKIIGPVLPRDSFNFLGHKTPDSDERGGGGIEGNGGDEGIEKEADQAAEGCHECG